MELKGKVALVTGSARGIGAAVAKRFAAEGATVVINYHGSVKAADDVLQEITQAGGSGMIYQCDVSDFTACEKMVQDIMTFFGRIDILVNNAGIVRDGLLMKMSEQDFDDVIRVNLKGAFNCTRHISRIMLKQKSGCMINLSSIVGLSGNAGQANYAASKAGIIGLTKSTAKELASRGITVNAIAPGYIDTDMTKKLSEHVKEQVLEKIPLRKMGTVQDIADIALMLATKTGSYLTGQVISVDGGMSIV